jgi:rSAM/selenodomain-associated transferase 1
MIDLIVFLKAPVAGEVKTRLQTRFSQQQTADIYGAFIKDTFATAEAVEADRCFAAYTGSSDDVEPYIPGGWNQVPQVEGDLGTRMLASLRSSIESGAEKAILIGSDIPSLPADHIYAAIDRLDRADVILGPTTDGGFYLIGTGSLLPDVFPDLAWSTERVFEQATEGIQQHNLRLGLIPPWTDIDTPKDLDAVLRDPRGAPLYHTRSILERIRVQP